MGLFTSCQVDSALITKRRKAFDIWTTPTFPPCSAHTTAGTNVRTPSEHLRKGNLKEAQKEAECPAEGLRSRKGWVFCALTDVPMLDWLASALLGQGSWSLMCCSHHFLCAAGGRPPAPADTLAPAAALISPGLAGRRRVLARGPQWPASENCGHCAIQHVYPKPSFLSWPGARKAKALWAPGSGWGVFSE